MQGARRIIAQPPRAHATISDTAMTLKRATTLAVVGGALAAWLAAAATSGNRQTVAPAAPTTREVDARGEQLAAEVARLHEPARPSTIPRRARNLFAFVSPKPHPASVVAAPALVESPRPAAAVPAFKLV